MVFERPKDLRRLNKAEPYWHRDKGSLSVTPPPAHPDAVAASALELVLHGSRFRRQLLVTLLGQPTVVRRLAAEISREDVRSVLSS